MLNDLTNLSPIGLLRFSVKILEELRRRNILTTGNAPLGDYAEWLFRQAFGWKPTGNSAKDIDAVDADHTRYQIKARRIHHRNQSRQLGAFRRLDEDNFDFLAAVLFNEDFSVMRAALIPHEVVQREAKKVEATNSWRFMLRDSVWEISGVHDVTNKLVASQKI